LVSSAISPHLSPAPRPPAGVSPNTISHARLIVGSLETNSLTEEKDSISQWAGAHLWSDLAVQLPRAAGLRNIGVILDKCVRLQGVPHRQPPGVPRPGARRADD